MTAKRKIGRPSIYTPELVAKLLRHLANGKSLRAVCGMKGMPTAETVSVWIREKPEFSERYAKARQEGFDAIADEALRIADDSASDPDPASRRVRVDTRKWLLGKWAPKRYGERVEIEHSGEARHTVIIGGDV